MQEYYIQFLKKFSIENYQRLMQELHAAIGYKYKFSTTPVFLKKERFEKLTRITEAVISLLKSPAYQDSVRQNPWFLPIHPLRDDDYFGCVDFHLSDNEEKIIEVNLHPPGYSGFVELLETKFIQSLLNASFTGASSGFEKALIKNISADLAFKRIAIVEIDVQNQHCFGEYQYIKRLLQKQGVDTVTCDAENVKVSESRYLLWDGVEYERILNRVVPSTIRSESKVLRNYIDLYNSRHEIFFINPWGWRLADKNLLTVLTDLDKAAFDLDESLVSLLKSASLETHKLSNFESAGEIKELFGSLKKIVLKPLDNYAGQGIFLKPSNPILDRLLIKQGDEYIVQKLFPAGKLSYITFDGSLTEIKYDVRIIFIQGRVIAGYARLYTGALANFKGENGGLAPIIVI